MASHIKHKKNFTRSDIPYASRLLMDKYKTIGQQRDDAAATSLKISLVALNDTEGLGYQRLDRYAKRLMELANEYYADPELEDVHLNQRLTQLGFRIIDGHVVSLTGAESGKAVSWNVVEKLVEEEQE